VEEPEEGQQAPKGEAKPAGADRRVRLESGQVQLLLEVKVVGVYEHPKGAFVLLRDGRGRAMPIFIGHPEALSISLAIEGHSTPRPLTHDLMKTVVEQLGGTLAAAAVHDLKDNTYFGALVLRIGEREVEVDCRPSDAIGVALRFGAPIYVADPVIEQAQVEWRETQDRG
jgi:bifunctional DNase/RNase